MSLEGVQSGRAANTKKKFSSLEQTHFFYFLCTRKKNHKICAGANTFFLLFVHTKKIEKSKMIKHTICFLMDVVSRQKTERKKSGSLFALWPFCLSSIFALAAVGGAVVLAAALVAVFLVVVKKKSKQNQEVFNRMASQSGADPDVDPKAAIGI